MVVASNDIRDNDNNKVSLKEYVEMRLCALDKRVDTAVENIERGTSAAFSASQKAIDKQEVAQNTYNSLHNNLSRQMKEQYSQMIPRTEFGITIERVHEDIKGLRESRSQTEGKGLGNKELLAYIIAGLSVVGFVLTLSGKI